MVGFNWVYKNNHLIRWCNYSLPSDFIVFFSSQSNPYLLSQKRILSTIKTLWISIQEICFPQKYIIKSMQSGGIRPANLQLLFSSKSRPELADCTFSHLGMLRPCPSADGLLLICPVVYREYEYITISRQGI